MAKEMREGTVPLYLYVPVKTKKDLEKIVELKQTTRSALARQIFEEFIDNFKSKHKGMK